MTKQQEQETAAQIPQMLADWYRRQARELPWRGTTEPYAVWVSEVMLQQTRVEAVKLYYARFMEALPTVNDLADCPQDRLLRLWEGLGYYNRAHNLQAAAKIIVEQYRGHFPETYKELLALPGFGPYTAGAVASICFDERVCAIDGNVLRVTARLRGDFADVLLPQTRADVDQYLMRIMPEKDAGVFNQALMELGETLCVPKGMPQCDQCPLRIVCRAYAEDLQAVLPVRNRKTKRKIELRTILLIRCEDLIAVRRRPETGLLAGMYELPGLDGHLDREAVFRRLSAAGYCVRSIEEMPEAKHIFTHLEWQMKGYLVQIEARQMPEDTDLIWIRPDETGRQYPIPGAFAAYFRWMGIEIGAAGLKREREI